MDHKDIVAHLRQLHPPETICELTTETVISEIVRRMGEENATKRSIDSLPTS